MAFAGVAGGTAIALESGLLAAVPTAGKQYSRSLTQQDIEGWLTELSNWGKWGPDDQAGTINLITPAKRRAAAALVREGVSVSMSLDADLPPEGSTGGPLPSARILGQNLTGKVRRAIVNDYHFDRGEELAFRKEIKAERAGGKLFCAW